MIMQSNSNSSSSPAIARGNPPFDDETTADLILRSCDKVEFHVHKIILSLASPFFKDMLGLKQPPRCTEEGWDLPVVDVTEDSTTLDRLLRFCYPVSDPELTTVSDISALMGVAMKYDMSFPFESLTKLLRPLRKSEPLQVYAVACRWNLDAIAIEAAQHWRNITRIYTFKDGPDQEWSSTWASGVYVEEMADISASAYQRLLRFAKTGAPSTLCPSAPEISWPLDARDTPIIYPPDTGHSDVTVQSSDAVHFKANKIMLSVASPVLKGLIDKSLLVNHSRTEDMHILQVSEDSRTVAIVLRLCYPMGESTIGDLDLHRLQMVIPAVNKYQIPQGARFGKRQLRQHIHADPLRVYYIAMSYGWESEARDAALQLARYNVEDLHSPVLEAMSAKHFYALLKFRHQYRVAMFRDHSDAKCSSCFWDNASQRLFEKSSNSFPFPTAEAVYQLKADRYGQISESEMVHFREWMSRLEAMMAKVELDIPR